MSKINGLRGWVGGFELGYGGFDDPLSSRAEPIGLGKVVFAAH